MSLSLEKIQSLVLRGELSVVLQIPFACMQMEDILAADPQLAKELLFDIRQAEAARRAAAAAARSHIQQARRPACCCCRCTTNTSACMSTLTSRSGLPPTPRC